MMTIPLIIVLAAFPFFYTVSLLLAAALRKRISPPVSAADCCPSLTVIISSSGEKEETIRQKLINTLSLDYPRDRLEIMLFSDGCPLSEKLRSDFPGVSMIVFDRLGKTECQNRCIRRAAGEIIVSTDVTALLNQNALRKSSRWYGDSRIGSVGGNFIYRFKTANPELKYIEREIEKKQKQARYGYVMGYLGPIYSFRKSAYQDMPIFYQSDYVLPLQIAARGLIAYYDAEIMSTRELDRGINKEYARKRRIVAQALATTLHFLLTNPGLIVRRPDLFFGIVSFKLFRWFLIPYLFVLYLFVWLLVPLVTIVSFIACAGVGVSRLADQRASSNSLIKAPYYAFLLAAANIAALFDVVVGRTYTAWDPGSR